ncbi:MULTISPECIES: hypothetical protein [unclassified Streptomyces]|uniref:hypothetical protein n=1 Tax=Streptomyces sp. SID6137 TaxID=2690319 RepID=UPI00136C163F|nr:hypothetical protein [Streptomyces sp. SID6139]MYR22726.1 hypothetical protein [Streptomyces sp. SID6137]
MLRRALGDPQVSEDNFGYFPDPVGKVEGPTGRHPGTQDNPAARVLLAELGCKEFADRRFPDCSTSPSRPSTSPFHEDLVDVRQRLAADRAGLATITVTHHLEELPPSTTHSFASRKAASWHPVPSTACSPRTT